MSKLPEITHTFDASGLDTANLLDKVSERLFSVASDWLGEIGHPQTLRDGVKVATFARKVEKLAAEARKLGI